MLFGAVAPLLASTFLTPVILLGKKPWRVVLVFPLKLHLISIYVLVKKSLNNDSNRIQAQEAREHIEEIS